MKCFGEQLPAIAVKLDMKLKHNTVIILEVYSIKDVYYYHKSVLVLHTIKPMNCYSVFVMLACL